MHRIILTKRHHQVSWLVDLLRPKSAQSTPDFRQSRSPRGLLDRQVAAAEPRPICQVNIPLFITPYNARTCTGYAASPIDADAYDEVETYNERKPLDDGYAEDGTSEDEDERLDPEDSWTVINSFFADKGLVRQQLESFNEFVENSMQEIVEERGKLVLDQYPQFVNDEDTVMVSAETSQTCEEGERLIAAPA